MISEGDSYLLCTQYISYETSSLRSAVGAGDVAVSLSNILEKKLGRYG